MKKLGIQKIVHVDEDGNLIHSKLAELDITHVSLGNRILSKE